MKEKHARFTIEVLQDQGMGSTGTVTKFCVTPSQQTPLVDQPQSSASSSSQVYNEWYNAFLCSHLVKILLNPSKADSGNGSH